jgi:hypothetical protein
MIECGQPIDGGAFFWGGIGIQYLSERVYVEAKTLRSLFQDTCEPYTTRPPPVIFTRLQRHDCATLQYYNDICLNTGDETRIILRTLYSWWQRTRIIDSHSPGRHTIMTIAPRAVITHDWNLKTPGARIATLLAGAGAAACNGEKDNAWSLIALLAMATRDRWVTHSIDD